MIGAVAAARRRAEFGRRAAMPDWLLGLGGFIRSKPLGACGAAIILLMLVMAVGAQWLAPYPYDVGVTADRLQAPSLAHPFGTDASGRDLLSRIIWGARMSVTIGFGAVLLSTLVAVAVGVTSGYFGGWVDLLVQRLVDIWISFPALVLLVSLVAILGPGLWSTTLVLGILLAPGTARVVRSAVLAMREQPYVESARCAGAGHARIVRSYVLPNVSAAILVLAGHDAARRRGPGRVDAEFSGLRRTATLSDLGSDAERHRPRIHAPITVAVDLAGAGDQRRGIRLQHARRRLARHI